MTRWMVSDCKTEAMARRAAVHMGWVDFTLERVE